MNTVQIGLDGLYQLETRNKLGVDAEGNDILSEPTVLVPWFGNLITNGGLDLLGNAAGGADNLGFCRVGTGTTAAANTDTALQTQVGSTSTVGTGHNTAGVGAGSAYIYRRVVKRFAAGAISGHTLSEVGMGPAATGQIFSRTLIKDSGGTPITITLPADQALDVVYELREYISNTDTVVNGTVDGNACTITMRPHGWPAGDAWAGRAVNMGRSALPSHWVGSSTTGPGGIETQPSGATAIGNAGVSNTNGIVWDAYTPGSYQRTAVVNFTLTQGNYTTGIGAIVMSSNGAWWTDGSAPGEWSFGFNPKLNKTSVRLATATVGLSWGRHTI